MNSESPEKRKFSLVVIGDTFSVQPRGAVCDLVMSNAYILRTTFARSKSNEVVQTQFRLDPYRWVFPIKTKLVFNDSVVELPKVKIDAPNTTTYDGDDALRQLEKMGLKPPK